VVTTAKIDIYVEATKDQFQRKVATKTPLRSINNTNIERHENIAAARRYSARMESAKTRNAKSILRMNFESDER